MRQMSMPNPILEGPTATDTTTETPTFHVILTELRLRKRVSQNTTIDPNQRFHIVFTNFTDRI